MEIMSITTIHDNSQSNEQKLTIKDVNLPGIGYS
jgi:hypothetical protein